MDEAKIGTRSLVNCQQTNTNDFGAFGHENHIVKLWSVSHWSTYMYLFDAFVSSFLDWVENMGRYWEGYLTIIKLMNEFDFVQWSYLMSIIDNNTLLTSARTVTIVY